MSRSPGVLYMGRKGIVGCGVLRNFLSTELHEAALKCIDADIENAEKQAQDLRELKKMLVLGEVRAED